MRVTGYGLSADAETSWSTRRTWTGTWRDRVSGRLAHPDAPHLLRWSRCRVVIWAIRSYGIGLASGNRAVLAPERYGDSCDS